VSAETAGASRRALVEFSIALRWDPRFRARLEELRHEWGIEPDGEDYDGSQAAPLPPRIEAARKEWRSELRLEYRRDIASVLREFVPLDRFPPPGAWRDDYFLGRFHALAEFVALCLRYNINELPAAAGIGPPGLVGIPRPGAAREGNAQVHPSWAYVAFPPDATREEVYRLVDRAFAAAEDWRIPIGNARRPRRGIEDVERTYQTWRLAFELGSPIAAAAAMVRHGYENREPSMETVRKRLRTAVRDWGLPPASLQI
jgi:hypothetical protein